MISLTSIISRGVALFAILFSPVLHAANLLPLDEKVSIREFKNGVTAYVHKNAIPAKSAFIRVVVKGVEKGAYECAIGSENLGELNAFFEDCKDKLKGKLNGEKNSLAVIAVGDFLGDAVAKMIEDHFASLIDSASYISLNKSGAPVRVQNSSESGRLGLRVNFPALSSSLRTVEDLRSKWKEALSHQILQERLKQIVAEKTAIYSSEETIFVLPSDPFTATLYCSEERIDEMTEMLFSELERLKAEGISENEFAKAKGVFMKKLQDLSLQGERSNSMLASYHTDLFTHEVLHPSFDSFVAASSALLPEISCEEMFHFLQMSLSQERRTVDVLLPKEQNSLSAAKVEQALSPFFISSENIFTSASHETLLSSSSSSEWEKAEEFYPETTLSPATWNPFQDPYDSLPLTSEEKRIIDKIFTTMAKKNVLQLAFEKNSMEKHGKRINHVHPMKMLGTLFSDPMLKDCLKKIRKSSFKWNGFLDGLVGRLKEEYKRDNLLKYAPGLAKLLGVNADKVKRYLSDQEWEPLVIYLLEH